MRAVTLLFHDVVANGRWESSGMRCAGADRFKLDVVEFRRHLHSISQQFRDRPVTAPALLASPSSARTVLLTFDDGGVSGINPVADILDKFGWKAHFLITTSRIGSSGFLNPNQIRDLHARGHIIGSHSCSHPDRMSFCSPEELNGEWQRSVDTLSGIIGEQILTASVPNGYYSARVASSAARHGIKVLFNSEPVVTSRLIGGCCVLGRFTVKRGYRPEKSAALAAGASSPRVQQYMLWNAKKVVKVFGGKLWLRARASLLPERTEVSSRAEEHSQS